MTLLLHRFPLSHYSEKARAVLDFKGLDYAVIEHRFGLGQIPILRLTGQRKVPVLEHDGQVVWDSTEIALYLERVFPGTLPLLPRDEGLRREVLALESRIDDVVGHHAWVVFARHALHEQRLMDAWCGATLGLRSPASRSFLHGASAAGRTVTGVEPLRTMLDGSVHALRTILGELSDRLAETPYLVGTEPSLADVAAVGLTLHLRFPHSRHLGDPSIAGLGVPDIAGDPKLARFFAWREEFYRQYLD